MAEHGIELVQFVNAARDFFDRHAEFVRQLELLLRGRAAEIRAAADRENGSWPAIRSSVGENADEILALIR